MSYIITDGTSYCHVTKTRAVEIVSERSQASEFASRLSAEKLLARATKKLQGFRLVEATEAGTAPAKRSSNRKSAKKQQPEKAQQKQQAEESAAMAEPAAQESSEKPAAVKTADPEAKGKNAGKKKHAEKKQTAAKAEPAMKNDEAAAEPEQLSEQPSTDITPENAEAPAPRNRRRSHRGGRRRRSGSGAADQVEAVQAEAAAQAEAVQDETAAAVDAAEGKIAAGSVASDAAEAEIASDAEKSKAQAAVQDTPEQAAAAEEPAPQTAPAEDAAAAPAEAAAPAPAVIVPGFKVVVHGGASAAAAKKEAPANEVKQENTPDAQEMAPTASAADVTVQEEEADAQPAAEKSGERNSSRNHRRNNRRKNRGAQSQESEDNVPSQALTENEADDEVLADQVKAKAEAPATEMKSEAVVPATDTNSEKAPAAGTAAPLPVPFFTVQTHHVSENAVARPTWQTAKPATSPAHTEADKSAPAADARKSEISRDNRDSRKSEPSRDNDSRKSSGRADQKAASAERTSLAAHEETAGKDSRPKREENASAQANDRKKSRKKMTYSDVHPDDFEDIEFDAPSSKKKEADEDSRKDSRRQAASGKKAAQEHKTETSAQSSASASSESRTRSGRTRTSSRRTAHIPAEDNRRRMFTQQERYLIYNRTEGHCGICGKFIPLEEYTIDHIIPLSKGGTNDLDNLQACCGFCNKAKDDSMGEDFFRRISNIFLYQAQLKYGKKSLKKLTKYLKELEDEIE